MLCLHVRRDDRESKASARASDRPLITATKSGCKEKKITYNKRWEATGWSWRAPASWVAVQAVAGKTFFFFSFSCCDRLRNTTVRGGEDRHAPFYRNNDMIVAFKTVDMVIGQAVVLWTGVYSSVIGGGAGGESWITSQRQCEAWLSKTHDYQAGKVGGQWGDGELPWPQLRLRGAEGAGGCVVRSWGGWQHRFQLLLDFECWMSHCSVMSMLSLSLHETE